MMSEIKSLTGIRKKFTDYCSPNSNRIFEKYIFHSIVQKESQIFNSFLTKLSKAVRDQDDMIRDKIVIEIVDKSVQERLLRQSNMKLVKAIELCRSFKSSKLHVQVNALRNKKLL